MEQQSSSTPAEQAVEPSSEGSGSKKSGLILKVILFVVGIGLGGTLGFTGYERIATMAYDGPLEEQSGGAEPTEYGEFYEISGIIINPTQSIGKRYLMVNIGLEGTADTIGDIEAKQIVIRDMVIRELGQRTTEELADVTKRDSLKDGIRQRVNDIISTGHVDRLYFTQYVIQ
jgi:flagellar FliL protein